jgi:hypothetical protein
VAAGGALCGCLAGLLLARWAQRYFKTEFDAERSAAENARLRAKVEQLQQVVTKYEPLAYKGACGWPRAGHLLHACGTNAQGAAGRLQSRALRGQSSPASPWQVPLVFGTGAGWASRTLSCHVHMLRC